jgi:AcrR family transcriptional regulator
MLGMSTPYEQGGYSQLKRRTREALVAAARELVARGITPTVEQVAEAAAVSRTTAYRYFPNQTVLLVAAHPEVGTESLLDSDSPQDPVVRLGTVIDKFVDLILDTEPQQRTMLRISLETVSVPIAPLPLRQGRAIAWISEALEPLHGQLTEPELHRLALAIRSAVGIEALVWLTDVAGLSRPEAAQLMRWSARSLLQAALTSGGPPAGVDRARSSRPARLLAGEDLRGGESADEQGRE